nr:MAG TPA: hypothetical protein [Caudoviricetes sp.]
MATLEFEALKSKYEGFARPTAVIQVNDKPIVSAKSTLRVSDIEVDLTCGYEASIATFRIFNVYNTAKAQFETEAVQKFINLGSKVEIYLGYGNQATLVFVGLIAKVSYQMLEYDVPCIQVTAMDAKSIMMAGNYSRQMTARQFTDAVQEILNRAPYARLKSMGIIQNVQVTQGLHVPAESGANAAQTIEMVAESDYEFLVKLAKRNNYEFFCECGTVIFRKAKEVRMPLLTLTPSMGVYQFEVEYDITGLSETIYARSTDPDKAKLIESKGKFSNKISLGNKAKPLLKGSERVYIDPTISSKEEAQDRVDSLMEDMAFRYGSLNMDMVGLPELKPGYFLDMQCMGEGPSNVFYMMEVHHSLRSSGGYSTHITGKTNAML